MKTAKIFTILFMVLGLVVWLAGLCEADSIGTAFTYQGKLIDANQPADGLYDFKFSLFDSPESLAHQVGTTIEVNDVDVIDGYFTMELDFGSKAFEGDARWLQIAVMPKDSEGGITILSPRQEVTPMPYAIYAKTAETIPGMIDGSGIANYIAKFTGPKNLGDSPIYEEVGNVGIGITSPEEKLHVSGDIRLDAGGDIAFNDDNTRIHESSDDLYLEADDDIYISPDDDIRMDGATLCVDGSENRVGIGTAAPGAPLEVKHSDWADIVKIGMSGTLNSLTLSSGADWASISGGTTNQDHIVIQHSTGNIGIGTTDPLCPLDVQSYLAGSSTIAIHGISTDVGAYLQAIGENGSAVCGKATGIRGKGVEGSGYGYDFYADGLGIDYGSSSSVRWKSDIRPIDDALAKVSRLRGVYFDWDAEHGGGHDIGMIAEEVGDVLPEIVQYEEDGIYTSGMDYSKLTPLLVEAVKALKTKVDEQQKRMTEKDAVIEGLQEQVAELKNLIKENLSS